MKTIERIIWISLLLIVVACADLSPVKDFTSTLYAIDWDSKCLTYVDHSSPTSGEIKTRCFSTYLQDAEGNWYPIDDKGESMIDIVGISTGDFKKEVNFQNFLKLSCKTWKSQSTK